jgi:LL-diaminopimelate aminotransferase
MKEEIMLAERLRGIPAYPFDLMEHRVSMGAINGLDVISFGVGDPDLPPDQAIIDALLRSVSRNASHRYPQYEGEDDFRLNVARWYLRRFGVKLDPHGQIAALVGSKEGIANLILAHVNAGDYVLVPDPAYPIYRSGTILAGGVPYSMPLLPGNRFLPDLGAIDAAVLNRTKIMFLNYPNNPTGAVADLDFYREAIALCRKFNIILCLDAAYSEISFDGYQAPSILQIEGASDIGVELYSFSKTYGMPGWRIGFAVGNARILSNMMLSKVNIDSGQFSAIQYAAACALQNDDIVKTACDTYNKRVELFTDGVNACGWTSRKNKATFYCWLPTRDGMSSDAFTDHLFHSAGIICGSGAAFGEYGEGFVRFSLTQDELHISAAIARLKSLFYTE